jgi:hypothetical protein
MPRQPFHRIRRKAAVHTGLGWQGREIFMPFVSLNGLGFSVLLNSWLKSPKIRAYNTTSLPARRPKSGCAGSNAG